MAFILTIRESHNSWAGRGPISTIYPTEEAAQAELVEYVREKWDARMDEDPPEDGDDELVEMYFGQALEKYIISEAA